MSARRIPLLFPLCFAAALLATACFPDFSDINRPTHDASANTSPNDNDAPYIYTWDTCSPTQQESISYTYTAQGVLQQVKRIRRDGALNITAYDDQGRPLRRTLGDDSYLWDVEGDWRYANDLLVRLDVTDRLFGEPETWSLVFTYDDLGRVSQARAQGVLTDGLIHDSYKLIGRMHTDGEEIEIADGVNLYWPLDASFVYGLILEPSRFIVSYTYDDQGRVSRAAWDLDADGAPDAIREDLRDDTSHTTLFYPDAASPSPGGTFERDFDDQGRLTERRRYENGNLQSIYRWSRFTLGKADACGVDVLSEGDGTDSCCGTFQAKRIKRFDAEGRLIFERDLNDQGHTTDKTWITYTESGRIEARDRNADSVTDQTTQYTYAADGALLSVTILEDSISQSPCDGGLGAWAYPICQ